MSPRKGPRRAQVAVRINDAGIKAINALADEAGTTRSEMVRRLLTAAVTDTHIRTTVTHPTP